MQIHIQCRNIQCRNKTLPTDGDLTPLVCPITGHLCAGDLSHLCEDYGCARKGGLSPHSDENY